VRTGRRALRRQRQCLGVEQCRRAVGYSGVTVWNPDGKLIGRIRLPEVCGNICFGGPKRNRLFTAASQSLYAVYTATQGAGPG
jgi:gluconolactonase